MFGDTLIVDDVLERVRAVLEDGTRPNARTAAVIALLSSSGALQDLHPVITWSTTVVQRAKNIENPSRTTSPARIEIRCPRLTNDVNRARARRTTPRRSRPGTAHTARSIVRMS